VKIVEIIEVVENVKSGTASWLVESDGDGSLSSCLASSTTVGPTM